LISVAAINEDKKFGMDRTLTGRTHKIMVITITKIPVVQTCYF